MNFPQNLEELRDRGAKNTLWSLVEVESHWFEVTTLFNFILSPFVSLGAIA
jgi:hypothetical protein